MAQRRGTLEDMVVDPGFWGGRRVFLTGHTGFKGGWLAYWLRGMGAHVTGYALDPPDPPSLWDAASIGTGMTDLRGDVRDAAHLAEAFATAQPGLVFHLAAQPLVRASYRAPADTFAVNVGGTVNLLEAARRAESVRVVVNVTSDKCYRNREWTRPYKEDDPLGGHDPYSASKAAAEMVTASYRDAFFRPEGRVRLASVRAGNVIGGGDWAVDRILPDLVRAFRTGAEAAIRNPGAVRPWQHVLDALGGYLVLAQRLAGDDGEAFAQAWNFGPADANEATVADIVAKARAAWGTDARAAPAVPADAPHEAGILRLDSTKARTRLGWRPRHDLDEAVSRTIAWYRADHAGDPVREVMDAQIADQLGEA